MKRLFAAVLLWGLLVATAPLPVHLTPARPLLGVPLLLTIQLPDAATELAGLPSLTPFELLEPPQRQGRQLRLLLLPMRPGTQHIPSIPLLQGTSQQLATAGMTVTVDEGLPLAAEAAPLKPLATGGTSPATWLAPLLLAAIAAAFLFVHRQRHPAGEAPPPLESLHGEVLLAELRRRLLAEPGLDSGRRQQLAEDIDRLRFAPVPPDETSVRQRLADYLALTREAP